uniref:Transposable element protein, putative, Retrotrans_gag n=1 Tax=Oryza sativa subsp. japonica TaxID=39947 RepID=Q2R0Y1_ORYSJ|nr:Transposable element protein, putative, Retrotrans_gag [Oryza sativa Japonica Group]
MADKTLREFPAPFANNVATGPQINMGDMDFDLKSSLITMAHASPFCAKPNKDANAHLQQFLEICSTYIVKGISPDAVRLRLFLFSLLGKEKQWFYANRVTINIWYKCSTAFLSKFFPMGKTNALRGRILSFQQTRDESINGAWERLQEYMVAYPHLGMDDWLILQNFYNGLTPTSGTTWTRQLEEPFSLRRFEEPAT